jgi:hypothetical protein
VKATLPLAEGSLVGDPHDGLLSVDVYIDDL